LPFAEGPDSNFKMSFRIKLEKESFKFSGSHFTVFGPDRAERLHGHNYYVRLELTISDLDQKLGMAFDFNIIKPIMREITSNLDEYILLPQHSPFVSLTKTGSSIEVLFSGKRYSLPESDVKVLPVVNITTEELARFIAKELEARIKSLTPPIRHLQRLSVGVEETRGQASFFDLGLASE
jgi:6-pyruvoyltetrahydropterin/6-carboxytetrahydropterin synthase